ncbi:SNARE Slt1 [Schizosaccharomyces cryophilus OY26]|uniref:SNARE Slt1 n=1 Tax=Schizosaccharomyces cryophilus (strain OY26 / ATCC MYA-4695 / CBS 11777 / NBRC 106824 / NRRL Y48691) TaxID=653667 RepID=S9W444_SCHCR|nr:SNARE Slt1 [Schizosaccharomyces cryophilus OY26]EPY52780.1 SNARE Slt1 [Schizosaccharomyces cryophilus OY26]
MSEDLVYTLERRFRQEQSSFLDPLELCKVEKNLDYARKKLWEEGKCQLEKVGEPDGLSSRIMNLQGRINDLRVALEAKIEHEEKKIKMEQEKEAASTLEEIRKRETHERQQEQHLQYGNSQLLDHQRSVQTEISESLLHMASVLKENAISFTNALVNDNQVVERAGSLLDKNAKSLDSTHQNVQHFTKSKKLSFWLQIGMVLAVIVSFLVMMFILQFTKNQN